MNDLCKVKVKVFSKVFLVQAVEVLRVARG
jgi:hypothetical protein